ncbi:MAG: class I SAM-dependent methyltransferase [Bdellovibrionaceae bacterium]|nr:class I SAM-dependent methyltransferase [Pseudobdellovibrionaceae bacterium]MDW8190676.1 class I SAM-dependent methyltransferase [Pseudobdellovibrionaceae bacterium]
MSSSHFKGDDHIYWCYQQAVQSPEVDVRFYRRFFKKHVGRDPRTFREDFCGTHILCVEWVRLNQKNIAYGIDIDPFPIRWGIKHNQARLNEQQRKRIIIFQGNVKAKKIVPTDIVVAANFSYFVFKERSVLLRYFKNVRESIKKDGLFFLDTFGGEGVLTPNVEKRRVGSFWYYWEQKSFNVINHHAQFAIHFRWKNRWYRNAFTYDWRLWTLPELQDCLLEAGFSSVVVLWEGTTRNGEGNGVFRPTRRAASCESWVAYLVASPQQGLF